jgi:hypothetical protein
MSRRWRESRARPRASGGSGKSWLKNPITGLRIQQALDKVQNLVGTVSEVAHAVNEMGPTPKLHNYVAIGTIGISKLIEMNEFDPGSNPAFKYLELFDFQQYVRRTCENHSDTKSFGKSGSPVLVSSLYGETVVFSGSGHDTSAYFLFREDEDQVQSVLRAVGRAIWEQNGNRLELFQSDDHRSGAQFRPWSLGDVLSSPQTDALRARVSKFLDAKARRSVLLHGPPGTGKSCMARALAADLNMPTLFLDATQVKYINTHTLMFTLDMLHPYVVIIDDLDRVFDVSSLLSAIDRIHSNSKVFVVTANDIESFDAAVVRAGRFDEIEEVIRVKAPSAMIPGLAEEVAQEIDDWPISFIEELRLRLEILGPDCLDEEMQRLRTRVENNEVTIEPASEIEPKRRRRMRRNRY